MYAGHTHDGNYIFMCECVGVYVNAFNHFYRCEMMLLFDSLVKWRANAAIVRYLSSNIFYYVREFSAFHQ